jgi:hypothetical protein
LLLCVEDVTRRAQEHDHVERRETGIAEPVLIFGRNETPATTIRHARESGHTVRDRLVAIVTRGAGEEQKGWCRRHATTARRSTGTQAGISAHTATAGPSSNTASTLTAAPAATEAAASASADSSTSETGRAPDAASAAAATARAATARGTATPTADAARNATAGPNAGTAAGSIVAAFASCAIAPAFALSSTSETRDNREDAKNESESPSHRSRSLPHRPACVTA